MCGLAGLLCPRTDIGHEHLLELAGAMGDALRHRGPDDDGVWADAQHGIALAHRRLSILDLSPLGHQPMASADGRYVMAFMFTTLILRTDVDPSYVGPAFDNDRRPGQQ